MKRRIDNLGRIVIPKEFRKELNINVNDDLELNIEYDRLILSKPIEEDPIDKAIRILSEIEAPLPTLELILEADKILKDIKKELK